MEEKKEEQSKKLVECETYSRVVGYYRPIKQWNKGKKEEFKNRENFDPAKINFDLE